MVGAKQRPTTDGGRQSVAASLRGPLDQVYRFVQVVHFVRDARCYFYRLGAEKFAFLRVGLPLCTRCLEG
jgi:hypothetical protein